MISCKNFSSTVLSSCVHKSTTATLIMMCIMGFSGLQANEDEGDKNIREIVVVGSRLAIDSSHVDVLDINEAPIDRSLAQMLRELPGYAISPSGNRGALTQVRVRGAEADHLKVMFNGFPLNTSAFELSMGAISTAAISKVSSLTGPQSTILGSNALAGVINLETRELQHPETLVGVGTQGARYFRHGYAKKTDATSSGALFSIDRGDGISISALGEETDGYLQRSWYTYSDSKREKQQIRTTLSSTSTYSNYDPMPNDGDRSIRTDLHLAGFDWSYSPNDWVTNEAQLSQTMTSLRNFSEGGETNSWHGRLSRLAFASNWLLNKSNSMSVAIDRNTESYNQKANPTPWGDPNYEETMESYGLSFEHLWTPRNMELHASVRNDQNDDFGNSTVWHTSIGNNFGAVFLSYSVGSNLKNPSFFERFGYTPDQFLGNPDLNPEKSFEHQVNIVYQRENLNFKLSFFNAELQNEIDGFSFDTASGQFTAVNLAEQRQRQGVELSTQRSFNKLDLSTSYTYVESDSNGDDPLLRRPKHLANLSASYRFSESWLIYGTTHYTGKQFDRNFFVWPSTLETLEPIVLTDLELTYKPQIGQAYKFSISNLFDTQYEYIYGYQTPGITGTLTVELDFGR